MFISKHPVQKKKKKNRKPPIHEHRERDASFKKKNIPSFPRQNPISPRLLIPPPPIHKPPGRIDLQTPKNVLGERYPAVIGRIQMIIDMNISPPTSSPGSALTACSARSIPSGGGTAETGTGAGTEVEAAAGS